jgi:Zn-dependent protease
LVLVSGFAFRPLVWIALVAIVLVHEAGHAAILSRYRLPVLHITVHGFGGEVETVDWITPWQDAVVAWGGVLAQLLLFVAVTSAAAVGLWPSAALTPGVYFTLTELNLLVACFNLLPLGNLDGRRAWRLPWLMFLRAKHAWLARRLDRARAAAAQADRDRLH